MPLKLAFVGAATYDAIAVVPRYPHDDERVVAETILYAGGGPAATAAVASARLGAEVSFIGPVGDDDEGRRARQGLDDEGVDISAIQIERGRQTQTSLIICSLATAARAIVTRDAMPFELGDAALSAVLGADWVHADHLGWPAVANALLRVPRTEWPKLSIDPGNALIGDEQGLCRIQDVQLYAPPLVRLQTSASSTDPRQLLAACPAGAVAATLGAGGSIGRGEDGRFIEVPGYRVPDLRSTLGAGDVFHGALVTAVSRGDSFMEALRYANAVAALACRGVDGRSAVPTHEETTLFIKENL